MSKDMTDNNSWNYALEFRLRELDSALHKRFTDCVFALQRVLSNYKLIFPEYTDHTELHSLTVVDFCNRLIGKQIDRLNKNEIYTLLLGCYFHDTGMGVSKKDFEAFSRQIDFGNYFELHPHARPESLLRDFHNEYSGLFIRKYASFFELPSEAHLEAVVQISRGHRKTDLTDEIAYPLALPTPEGGTICLPYLAALLRLADEIDVTASRNPVMLYDLEAMTDEKQRFEHRRHRAVRELEISEEAFTLVVDDSDPVLTEKIESMAGKMLQTLLDCRVAVNGRTPYVITQCEVRIRRL